MQRKVEKKIENQYLLKDKKSKKLLEAGAKSISDLFVERELIYD